MGMVTHNNDGTATASLTRLMLKLSRENALQTFNNYRRHFGMNPYKSFYALTKNRIIANKLKLLYKDVENVELITGMVTESKSTGVMSPTTIAVAYNSILNAILKNSLSNKHTWNPVTFGGNVGFDTVRFASIEKLVCNNIVEQICDDFKVNLYAK